VIIICKFVFFLVLRCIMLCNKNSHSCKRYLHARLWLRFNCQCSAFQAGGGMPRAQRDTWDRPRISLGDTSGTTLAQRKNSFLFLLSDIIKNSQGRTQGGWDGVNPPWAWYFT